MDKNGAVLDNGEAMTAEYFLKVKAEEIEVVKREVGEKRWTDGDFETAAKLLDDLCLSEGFETFLTLQAYRRI